MEICHLIANAGWPVSSGTTLAVLSLTWKRFFEHFTTLRSQAQWIPIIFGPLAGAMALVTAWRIESLTLRLFSITAYISMVIGGLGLYYHGLAVMRGLAGLEATWTWPQLLAVLRYAPPFGAPAAFVAMGGLGLLVHACTLRLERLLVPTPTPDATPTVSLRARVVFAVAFLLLVLLPLSPAMIQWLL